MLKADYGLAHGAANRVAAGRARPTVARRAFCPTPSMRSTRAVQPSIRAIHDRIIEVIDGLGDTFEISPKKGYLSLRRRVQFGMLKPAAAHLDVALVLRGVSVTRPARVCRELQRSVHPPSQDQNGRRGRHRIHRLDTQRLRRGRLAVSSEPGFVPCRPSDSLRMCADSISLSAAESLVTSAGRRGARCRHQ